MNQMTPILKSIDTVEKLASYLDSTPTKLTFLAYQLPTEQKYSYFNIVKKSGGLRKIESPIENLKYIQRKVALIFSQHFTEVLIDLGIENSIINGFINKKSIITNAKKHKNKKYVINIDISNFFDSFHYGRVFGYLEKNRYCNFDDQIAKLLSKIACSKNSLPQGSPLSPILTNLIFQPCDIRLLNFSKKHSLTYTRYADDLTFSTNKNLDFDKIIQSIEEIIKFCGFEVNVKKTRLQKYSEQQSVTGIVVNERLSVPKSYYKNVRSMTYSLIKTGDFTLNKNKGIGLDGLNLKSKVQKLEGMINYIDQIELFEKCLALEKIKPEFENKKALRILNKKEETSKEFLTYKYFYGGSKSLIICEGATDIIHIGSALDKLVKRSKGFYDYGHKSKTLIKNYSFFKWNEKTDRLLGMEGGTSSLVNIASKVSNPEKFTKSKVFKGKGVEKKIIYVLDYDDAGIKALNKLKKIHNLKITENPLVHKNENVFVITISTTLNQEIEGLYSDEVLDLKIGELSFNKDEKTRSSKEYGKKRFAEEIIQKKNFKAEVFSGFLPFTQALSLVLNDQI